jgi:hypothetical protein
VPGTNGEPTEQDSQYQHNKDTDETAHGPVRSSLGFPWYHSLTHRVPQLDTAAAHAACWARLGSGELDRLGEKYTVHT